LRELLPARQLGLVRQQRVPALPQVVWWSGGMLSGTGATATLLAVCHFLTPCCPNVVHGCKEMALKSTAGQASSGTHACRLCRLYRFF
jgi:hypothetical protein